MYRRLPWPPSRLLSPASESSMRLREYSAISTSPLLSQTLAKFSKVYDSRVLPRGRCTLPSLQWSRNRGIVPEIEESLEMIPVPYQVICRSSYSFELMSQPHIDDMKTVSRDSGDVWPVQYHYCKKGPRSGCTVMRSKDSIYLSEACHATIRCKTFYAPLIHDYSISGHGGPNRLSEKISFVWKTFSPFYEPWHLQRTWYVPKITSKRRTHEYIARLLMKLKQLSWTLPPLLLRY